MNSSSDNPSTEDRSAICVRRAIDCIGREYPNHPRTLLTEPTDLKPPRQQTPAFFGCFDWHSAVHAHWLLVRVLRCWPEIEMAEAARRTLRGSLAPANLRAEHRYLTKPGREGFERPYGLAWLLRLAAELHAWDDPLGESIIPELEPLESLCRERLADCFMKLTHPIRTGEHNQTAFSMGLALDATSLTRDDDFTRLIASRARDFYAADRDLPITFEPSGHDFLSPALAEADLLRRVMEPAEFSEWFAVALPLDQLVHFQPVASPDQADGKLAHLDGLNLSRAWMLSAIAEALPSGSEEAIRINELAQTHRAAGRSAIASHHYAGTHWLGTFYVYDATRRMSSA